ncbi:MAG: hypothetical protein IT176_10520 [Acidobacteria bacterium]|nr:hypothetical protein [Acidobacteriota bacterium]
MCHLTAMSYGPAIVAALLLALPGGWTDRIRASVVFGLAAAIAPAVWIAAVLIADPHGLDTLLRVGRWKTAMSSGFANLDLEATTWVHRLYDVPIFCLIVLGVVWLVSDPDLASQKRRALAGLIVPVVLFKVFVMEKLSGYYVLYPMLALSLAVGGATAWAVGTEKTRAPLRTGLIAGWLLMIAASSATIFGTRLAATTVQRQARNYDTVVTAAVREAVPPGSVLWGDSKAWYAVVETGSILRAPFLWFNPAPEPAVDRFAIVQQSACPAPYEEMRRIGQPLPPVIGRTFADTDYTFVICALTGPR